MARIQSNPAAGMQCGVPRLFICDAAWHLLRTSLCILNILGCVLVSVALEPTTPLASYGRQSWVMENGLPQNTVQAMVQTRDGFIWLGTEVGLVRFDGSGFVLFDRSSNSALPGNDVRCLFEAQDGALWIGTSEGLARWKDGASTNFTISQGLPSNDIRSLAQDAGGAIVVHTEGGRALVTGTHVQPIDLGEQGTIEFATQLSDHRIAEGTKSILRLIRSSRIEKELRVGRDIPGTRIQVIFADREGSLWIGTNGGLVRWINGQLEKLPITDPLASASVLTLMEDRERDIWVGTETGGLHILRDERFRSFGAREGLSSDATTTVVEDETGTLWVGTTGSGLNAVSRNGTTLGKIKTYTVRDGLLSDVILSLAAAQNGELWVGTPDGLNRIRKGVVTSFTSSDGLPDDFIRSLLVDKDGSLWIGTRRGLTHANRDSASLRFETFTQANGLGSDLVGAMTRDIKGNLWVATLAGLLKLQGSQPSSYTITNYTASNGLSSNVVTALLSRSDGTLLIGTQDHGWNLWDGQRFSAVSGNGLDGTTIHAILYDGNMHLWFATANGLARCDCDLKGGCSHWVEFGPGDGLRGRETATNSHPSAWRSRDGLLWFATPKGLVEVDPAHFPVNLVPAPMALVRFAVDDVDQALHPSDSQLSVAAGHVHFQFDYAGLSFIAPQKVRYRYTLEGFDHHWTDAGARRTAYYTNIPPGRYTFRVEAANNDGLWNTAGTALHFELRPHFYQTVWFYILLVVFAAGLVVLLLRLRLLRAEREFRAVLGERSRIAREVHDTLAQGYVGISVQLEVVSELLRQDKKEAAASQLDTTRGFVREGLAEARQSIWALRSQDSAENTLPVKVRRITEQAGGNGIESRFSLFGAYRPMSADVELEFLRVAQEAIHNVKKHAGPKNLYVQLEYGPSELALEVRDDGRGFNAQDSPDSTPGHYGVIGMKERAAAIAGVLKVTSEPGAGTTVRLQVSAPREKKNESHSIAKDNVKTIDRERPGE